jgi:hypothetical protein
VFLGLTPQANYLSPLRGSRESVLSYWCGLTPQAKNIPPLRGCINRLEVNIPALGGWLNGSEKKIPLLRGWINGSEVNILPRFRLDSLASRARVDAPG